MTIPDGDNPRDYSKVSKFASALANHALKGALRALYEVFGYRLAMPQLQHILIAVLALYCCFMVFKVSANAGFFLLPLLFVLPPLVFKSRKKESGEEE